eukprot:scaffold604_cov384-Prasinococcus_capsulatus_cf.AAC.41
MGRSANGQDAGDRAIPSRLAPKQQRIWRSQNNQLGLSVAQLCCATAFAPVACIAPHAAMESPMVAGWGRDPTGATGGGRQSSASASTVLQQLPILVRAHRPLEELGRALVWPQEAPQGHGSRTAEGRIEIPSPGWVRYPCWRRDALAR